MAGGVRHGAGQPEGDLSRRFPLHSGQRFLTYPALPTRAPAAAHFAAPLSELGIEPGSHYYRLSDPNVSPPKNGPIILHPGSGSARKNWPADCWLELLRHLPGRVTLVLGEAELERWALPLAAGVQTDALINQPLPELVAHLSTCRLFLGHDSGISHLAAAAGARCVLLFGPTDPSIWAPPTPDVRVLREGDSLAAITVADVRRAVDAALRG